jgi:hypothetical protein
VAGHYEIDGDEIRPLDRCLEYPDAIGDDSEDVSDLLAPLPLVDVNPDKHFVKQPKYRSEIENLVLCQGGQVPGTPLSPSIIQLLGKSADGKLVFDKFVTSAFTLGRFSSLATYKSWVLQLIDGLEALHSVGIVHRDLRADNFVFSRDGRRLVIIDLESRWGVRAAPEIAPIGGLDDSGWSRNPTSTTSETASRAWCTPTNPSRFLSNGPSQLRSKPSSTRVCGRTRKTAQL